MAITAYTGLPGSGKSYSVVKHVILPALQKGRRVWANIPLDLDAFDPVQRDLITPFLIADIRENPEWFASIFSPGATIVLDEVWDLWPAGMKATDISDDHKGFLAKHRHMVGADGNSTEVVLVTQDLAQIAAYPRGLVETTYRTEKLVQIGRANNYRIDVYRGSAAGPNPPEKQRIRQLFGKYEANVYRYYTSQTMSQSTEHGDETRTDSRTNILSSPWLKFGLPLFALAVVAFVYVAYDRLSSMYHPEPKKAPVTSPDPSSTSLPTQPKTGTQPPAQAAYKHFYSGMDAYIAWNNGRFPWIDFKIGFSDDERTLVMAPDQLGKLGYQFIAHDQCFGQLIGHGDTLNIYCAKPHQDQGENSIIDL